MNWPESGYAWSVDPDDEGALSGTRRLLRDLVQGHSLPMADDALASAELCLSEVVTNALVHTKAPCRVHLGYRDGVLRVSVADTDPCHPVPRTAVAADESGRGLLLLAALARDWGSTATGNGKEVWFEMGRPTPPMTASEQLVAAVRPLRRPRPADWPASNTEDLPVRPDHPRRQPRMASVPGQRRSTVHAGAAVSA